MALHFTHTIVSIFHFASHYSSHSQVRLQNQDALGAKAAETPNNICPSPNKTHTQEDQKKKKNENATRTIPQASINWRYPLIHVDRPNWIIEPRAMISIAPNNVNKKNIPNENKIIIGIDNNSNVELVTEISVLAQTIQQTQEQYKHSSPRQKTILKASLSECWTNLDSKVYQLYDLTVDQISFFNERGRNINRLEILDRL